jgi:deazaflavin-dependent oxidoreductase (nitroreductase family)
MKMPAHGFEDALDGTDQIELTTTGRVTGKLTSRPVWYVRHGSKLYLLPVTGSDSQWYKNVLKTPAIGLAAGTAHREAVATPITDPQMVGQVVDDFRAKYGQQDVAAYYPNPNTAIEVAID